ncbi:hypothetical protein MS3_00007288 [Schistosoma haematobium]|uniref:Uncharacterized protein n=1 Tax=Schistosoma haematobium TaxID=6185 RepID=A0A6A5DRP2_SCHHA|nr:hypothetical protein MS3_00007288 [Schistosoma haematobium]KAH9582584.1 hypothetical protein MS3_00007288 [Schistosoma haematobium]
MTKKFGNSSFNCRNNFGDQLHVKLRNRLIAGINILVDENILNRLHGSKMFSKVDLKDAYLQIPLDQSSSILMTINTPFGLFKYNFLPFRLGCSQAIFQEVMNKAVGDLEVVEVYQDELVVHGSNKVVHDQRLIALLRRLIEKNITVNPNKCSSCVYSFECLGYLVDGNGFRPDMKRLASLTNAPSSKNPTELRSLVGALQYYSRFIPNFSCRENYLFNILTSNSFKLSEEPESCLRSLLNAYDYVVQHRSAKQIQRVDYISRQPLQDRPINTSDCLLAQPLPVRRSDLIRETRRYFGCILSAIWKGWTAGLKRKFSIYFSKRDGLSTTPDGILCLNDRVVIPPSLRKSVLEDLHSCHLGVEKMKPLARLTCRWPEINADICHTANNCEKCHQLKNHPSKWVPWLVSSEAWQRIHADYCGPFLVIDSFSKWPEFFFTTSPNSDFTFQALRKIISREGVPMVLMTDNGSHFAADEVTTWLNGIGCKHLFTAPRHRVLMVRQKILTGH